MEFSLRNWSRGRLTAGYEAWNRYFFSEMAVDSLALYRVFFCLVVFFEAMSWLPYSEELFSTEGFHVRYTFFSAQMSPLEAKAFVILLGVCSLSAAIGYYTRLNLVLTLVCYAFLHSVDFINEKAVETIVMVVLSILIFSPCNRLYSLDVYLGRLQRREKGVVFFQRLLQWEFVQIYFFCGVTKMMTPEWPTGKVIIDSLTGRWASDAGIWLSGLIPEWAIRGAGFGTIIFELFVGVLLLTRPLRWLGVVLCLAFHLSIEIFLDIGSLGRQFMAADLFLFFNPDRAAVFIRALVPWGRHSLSRVRESLRRLRPAALNN